jgi:hypothetical protein
MPRQPRHPTPEQRAAKARRSDWDRRTHDEFIASAEVAAFAVLLERLRLPDIAEIIWSIGRHCGYAETAKRFRPAFNAFRKEGQETA